MQPPEKKTHAEHVEAAYREFAEGVDRSLAPLRVVARLAALPQGAENCVDLWEVVDTVTHFVEVVEQLRDRLDVNLEIGGSPGGTFPGHGKKASEGKKGSSSSSPSSPSSQSKKKDEGPEQDFPAPDGRN